MGVSKLIQRRLFFCPVTSLAFSQVFLIIEANRRVIARKITIPRCSPQIILTNVHDSFGRDDSRDYFPLRPVAISRSVSALLRAEVRYTRGSRRGQVSLVNGDALSRLSLLNSQQVEIPAKFLARTPPCGIDSFSRSRRSRSIILAAPADALVNFRSRDELETLLRGADYTRRSLRRPAGKGKKV